MQSDNKNCDTVVVLVSIVQSFILKILYLFSSSVLGREKVATNVDVKSVKFNAFKFRTIEELERVCAKENWFKDQRDLENVRKRYVSCILIKNYFNLLADEFLIPIFIFL